MDNPFKVGDKVEVTSSTAYGSIRAGHTGTVVAVFDALLTRYCVWLRMDTWHSGDDWPFALDEIRLLSPAEGTT
jgi:hypothetical protein